VQVSASAPPDRARVRPRPVRARSEAAAGVAAVLVVRGFASHAAHHVARGAALAPVAVAGVPQIGMNARRGRERRAAGRSGLVRRGAAREESCTDADHRGDRPHEVLLAGAPHARGVPPERPP
jgi:hypothetical protein